jgi:hypothetical protein
MLRFIYRSIARGEGGLAAVLKVYLGGLPDDVDDVQACHKIGGGAVIVLCISFPTPSHNRTRVERAGDHGLWAPSLLTPPPQTDLLSAVPRSLTSKAQLTARPPWPLFDAFWPTPLSDRWQT